MCLQKALLQEVHGDDGQPQNNRDSGADVQHESVLEEIINDTPCGSALVYWLTDNQ